MNEDKDGPSIPVGTFGAGMPMGLGGPSFTRDGDQWVCFCGQRFSDFDKFYAHVQEHPRSNAGDTGKRWRVLTKTGRDTWMSSKPISSHQEAVNVFLSLENDLNEDVLLVKEERRSFKEKEI